MGKKQQPNMDVFDRYIKTTKSKNWSEFANKIISKDRKQAKVVGGAIHEIEKEMQRVKKNIDYDVA
jgi:uncharacterized FlaG/YvyC family protein